MKASTPRPIVKRNAPGHHDSGGRVEISFANDDEMRAILAALAATPPVGSTADFDKWWREDGQYLDPDTSDVPWFDKRRELARYAYDAALRTPPQTDYFGSLVERARAAAAKASVKFPQPNYVTLKIAEEAGEVVRGAVHYAENRMAWSEVESEIVQLIAMLIRFVTEGDDINGVKPPPCRASLVKPS